MPQSVFTNVVRPGDGVISIDRNEGFGYHESAPVPEAPQTIRQNWIPFLTFFFLRVLSIYASVSARAQWPKAGVAALRCHKLEGEECFGEGRTEDMVGVER